LILVALIVAAVVFRSRMRRPITVEPTETIASPRF
jgi:hypothetical protein